MQPNSEKPVSRKLCLQILLGASLIVVPLAFHKIHERVPARHPINSRLSRHDEQLFNKLIADAGKRNGRWFPDKSGESPGGLTMSFKFEYVDDIGDFKKKMLLWGNQKQQVEAEKNLNELLSRMQTEGISPGGVYDTQDYVSRHAFMLSIVKAMVEAGKYDDAKRLLNNLIASIDDIGANDLSSMDVKKLKLLLKAESLWTNVSVNDDPDAANKALDLYDQLIEIGRRENIKPSPEIYVGFAQRRLTVARLGIQKERNLSVAKRLLETQVLPTLRTPETLALYIAILDDMGEYDVASSAIDQLMSILEASRTKTDELQIDGERIVQIKLMSKLKTPERFKQTFGPFAAAIYGECHHLSLSESARVMHQEPLPKPDPADSSLGYSAFLIGDSVILENGSDASLCDQADIMMHEFLHSQVQNNAVMKCQGHWFPVVRDVPTAALSTYLSFISKSKAKRRSLPPLLSYLVRQGNGVVVNDPSNCDKYVENMLSYFYAIGRETEASYTCAAIYAGFVDAKFKRDKPGTDSLYCEHICMFGHRKSVRNARNDIKIQL